MTVMQRIKLQQQQQDSINKSPMFFAYFRGFDTNGLLIFHADHTVI
jgi:hypothetical protein